jgi:hypothetical protein
VPRKRRPVGMAAFETTTVSMISTVSSLLTPSRSPPTPNRLFDRLKPHFPKCKFVELTLSIALCGFFNRFNDALQIDGELERHFPSGAVHI